MASRGPSALSYRRTTSLAIHHAPINSLSFSNDGHYLASGGDDGYICIIMSPEGCKHKIRSRQGAVVALRWLKKIPGSQDCHLLSAGSDGSIKLWRIGGTSFTFIRSKLVTDHPIEEVDSCGDTIAVVGRGGVTFYDVRLMTAVLFEPTHTNLKGLVARKIQTDPSRKPRGVCFFNGGRAVMVGTFEGIIIGWDLRTRSRMWREKLETRIGNMKWGEESQTLAVWNMEDGVDIYDLQDGPVQRSKIPLTFNRNYTIQISFLDKRTLALGSDRGFVFIVDISSRSVLKKLRHEDFRRNLVQTVASCQRVKEANELEYVITSSSSEPGKAGSVRVWTTGGELYFKHPWKTVVQRAILFGLLGSLFQVLFTLSWTYASHECRHHSDGWWSHRDSPRSSKDLSSRIVDFIKCEYPPKTTSDTSEFNWWLSWHALSNGAGVVL